MKTKYLILGAGMTGCAAARLLQMRGEEDIILLERNEEAGGLCRTKRIGSHVLDIGGGHFLCTRYQEVYDFIFSHIPETEFNRFQRVSKVQVDGEIIDYPIEYNLWQLSEQSGQEYVASCLHAGEVEGRPQPSHFEEWIRWKLGDRIADRYMLPYNRKIWGVEPEEMDIDWLSKLPRVDTDAILTSWKNRHSDRERMPSHDYFYYPKEGGFQRIFDAISSGVRDKVWLSRPLHKLEHRGDCWRVNDEIDAEIIINTIPWHAVHNAVAHGRADLQSSMERLQISSLVVSLYEEPYSHDWHWLYLASESIPHHREFFIHNFAPHSAPGGLYRETNLKRWAPGHGEIFHWTNDAAYPIPVRGHAAAIRTVLDSYAQKRLYGLGRWGQHAYFNSDVCIREAMKLVKNL
jgi:protoporphyrinogen oxidase